MAPLRSIRSSIASAVALLLVVGGGALAATPFAPLAAPGWPPSSGLLVSEVMTGGASASDEFLEIYNASATSRDLAGLELVYATATGSTVTRKVGWSGPTPLGPGRHLLLANASGAFAGLADSTYSGGLAATGGGLILRTSDGTVIDSLSWGEAANPFVEGFAGAAPPAGASLERRPGGSAGNGVDTNDNLVDTFIQTMPRADGSDADPVPAATPSASPPSSSATPLLTLPPTPTPPPPSPSEAPPTAAPPTVAPSPSPSTASPSATPDPSPAPLWPIAAARAAPDGTTLMMEGTLTTSLGLLESGRGAFVQDDTGGIALYLGEGDWEHVPAGTVVRVTGMTGARYGQATVRLAQPGGLTVLGAADVLPEPRTIATGAASELFEGLLIRTGGEVVSEPSALSDGYAVDVDDGSGTLRVVAAAGTGLGPDALARGSVVELTGVLGQRDATGTGLSGYRLFLRDRSDVVTGPSATPTPSPSEEPTPTPPQASPGPSETSTPTPSPTPTSSVTAPPAVISIAEARSRAHDSSVTVEGSVTVEPGRLIDERTFFVQDGTAGIAVRLDGSFRDIRPARGERILVEGRLGQRYGTLEIRLAEEGRLTVLGAGVAFAPRRVASSELGEEVEGELVLVEGELTGVTRGSTGSLTLQLADGQGESRVFAFPDVAAALVVPERGSRLAVVGIAGQRASGRDRADGYRVWPRDASDVVVLGPPVASPSPTPSTAPSVRPDPTGPPSDLVPIREALGRPGERLVIRGIVTSPVGLLDSDRRRVTVEDDSAAVLVRLPGDARHPRVGDRITVVGEVGPYYGAPQFAAEEVTDIGRAAPRTPAPITRAPIADADEWRLMRTRGSVVELEKRGDGWRAEIALPGGGTLPVQGVARSGIVATALAEGDSLEVTGIARRPYPGATDRRLALVPRLPADVRRTARPLSPGGTTPDRDSGRVTGGGSAAAAPGAATVAGGAAGAVILEADLARLAELKGYRVRLGAYVGAIEPSRIMLRDGRRQIVARLRPTAAAAAALLEPGEVVNVIGRVRRTRSGLELAVGGAMDVVRVGSLRERAVPAAQPQGSRAVSRVSQAPSKTVLPGKLSAGPTVDAAAALVIPLGMIGLLAVSLGVILDGRRTRP